MQKVNSYFYALTQVNGLWARVKAVTVGVGKIKARPLCIHYFANMTREMKFSEIAGKPKVHPHP